MARTNSWRTLFLTALLSLFMCSLSPSDGLAVGETGAQFLKIGVGAKAGAMGGAFVALADDATAVYWNPAGLCQAQSLSMQGTYFKWFEEMSYHHVSAAIPAPHGCLGAAIGYFSSGDIPHVDADLNLIGEYDAYDFSGSVAYASRLGGVLSLGVGVKLIQMKIEEESATGFAVGLGTIVDIPGVKGLSVGGSVQNLGPDIKFIERADPLPLAFRVGAGCRWGPLTLAGDVYKPRDNDPSLHLGGELVLARILALRAGFMTRNEMENALTFGFGIQWRQINAGYGYVPFEEIEDTHRVSVGLCL